MVTSTLVIIPTYNERGSLPIQIEAVRRTCPEVDILVVDDASPDGTGAWADGAAHDDAQVFVLHRAGKEGLGTAYLAGFAWGIARGYHVLVEMDADGSHRAEDLSSLLEAQGPWDLVIGSRWIPGGQVLNWPWHRRLLSTSANAYVRILLSLGVRDSTAGFRAYRAEVLAAIDFSGIESHGYCFQIDMTRRVLASGGAITEVPIIFVERTHGSSKMTGAIIREALWKVTRWGIVYRVQQVRCALRRSSAESAGAQLG